MAPKPSLRMIPATGFPLDRKNEEAMKSIFDKTTRDELTSRINLLHDNSAALWGKMNVYQMVRHCRLWEEMIQGNQKHPRAFAGLIFGKMALKNVLKDEA